MSAVRWRNMGRRVVSALAILVMVLSLLGGMGGVLYYGENWQGWRAYTGIGVSAGAAEASQEEQAAINPGQWDCDGVNWVAGRRAVSWSGNTFDMGEAGPPGAHVSVASDIRARKFRMFLYSQANGDGFVDMPFSQVKLENPGINFPTGRLDPVGTPTLTLERGNGDAMLKIWFVAWDGDSGANNQLWRIYTYCWWREDGDVSGEGPFGE